MVSRVAALRADRVVFYDSQGSVGQIGNFSFTSYPGQPQAAGGNRRATITRITPLNQGNQSNTSGGSTLTQQKLKISYLQQAIIGDITTNLTHGIGPAQNVAPPCVEPTIFEVGTPVFGVSTVTLSVNYESPDDETDIALLFLPGNARLIGASSISQTGTNEADIVFPRSVTYASGSYTLKVMRQADPLKCFSVRPRVVTLP